MPSQIWMSLWHAGTGHAEEYLGAFGLGRWAVHALERSIVLGHAVTGMRHDFLRCHWFVAAQVSVEFALHGQVPQNVWWITWSGRGGSA